MALLALALAPALLATACSSDDSSTSSPDTPTVVVTTSILGDVVSELLGDAATVETVMPQGVDPHDFQASAQQVAAMNEADVLVTNGAGFEEGLHDTIDAVEGDGVPTCAAIDSVDTLELAADGHGHEADHTDEHGGVDPHFFTDPARMVAAAEGLTDCILAAVPELDTAAVRASADAYVDRLRELDRKVEETLAPIPPQRRVLITNHEVFGYFADRYGFEVAGAVIPSLSTQSEASAGELADLAALIRSEGVPAVFADTSSPNKLAEALASEAGDVKVVELFSESLGPDGGETYVRMMTTNAQRIADALA